MQLISASASPFVRKVRVMLIETGQTDAVELVPVATTPLSPASAVSAANPLRKIPALIRENAPTLYDSRVITRFLDDRVQAGLYPEARIWEVLTLEATGDAIMDAAVLITYESRLRPPEKQFKDWTDAQWGKITGALDALETRWISHLAGPLDMGQISVACALGYLDLRHGPRGWRDGRGALDDWFAAFSARESFVMTMPEG